MPSTSSQSNFLFDDRMYRTSNNFDTFPYIDQGIPLMSPINPNTKLYPTSTRNYFNIDLLNEGNYHIPLSMQNYNMFRQPGGILHSGYMTSPGNYDMAGLSLTPNKEIALHNKILINESDLIGMQNYNLARNSNYQLLEASKKEEYKNDMKNMNISASAASGSSNNNVNNLIDYSEIQNHKRKLSEMNRKPSLDLTKINENEVGKFFQQSLVRKESDSNNNMPSDSKASLNLQLPSEFSAIAMKAEEAPARTDDKEQDIYQPSKSDSENIREDSKSISNDNNEDYQIVPIQEGDRFHTEEYKEHLQGDSSHVSKNYDTISVSNTSVKSFNEENNSILINESNINRYDVLNMYNTSNVNRDNITNKSTVDMTNLTPQQLQQMQQHETKAILNISPKSAFVKMKCIQKN